MKQNHFFQQVTPVSLRWFPAFLAVFLLAASMPAPARAGAEITLTFGTYAADKPTETVRKYGPFLAFLAEELSQELGEPVQIKMKIDKDYDAAIETLASGVVDFARFGPASYVTAKELNPDITILAMESTKGKKRFKGVIAVHQDSELQSLEGLRGQSFAFGDELSTIGRYLAQSHLLNAGISASELKDYAYLGRHDIVGEAVGAGKFTAGALKESTFKKLVAKGVPIRALLHFDNVTKPWIASSDLSPDVSQALSRIMLRAENSDAVRSIAKHGFLAGTDDDYDFVRRAIHHSLSF